MARRLSLLRAGWRRTPRGWEHAGTGACHADDDAGMAAAERASRRALLAASRRARRGGAA
jgi:hypothetical protein